MKGLVLVTHARLAEEFLTAAEMIIGPVTHARAVSIRREDDVETLRSLIEDACRDVGADGEGVVIMTDMFGGTPSNLSIPLVERYPVEILAGVNLPMVLKFFGSRSSYELPDLAAMLRTYSREGISLVSDLLRRPLKADR